LRITTWLAPIVWLMSWLGYINGSPHQLGMLLGFAGSQTPGQLDLATRYKTTLVGSLGLLVCHGEVRPVEWSIPLHGAHP
jgi:hypothetical protein